MKIPLFRIMAMLDLALIPEIYLHIHVYRMDDRMVFAAHHGGSATPL